MLCGAEAAADGLCPGCRADLPRLPLPSCRQCAVPVGAGALCGACLATQPRYDRTVAAYTYDFPVDALIQAFKYAGELRLARLLGDAMAQRTTAAVDALLPMPLSEPRLRERGYNQALELARVVGRVRGVPVWPMACRRVVDTPAQALLPWKERARNVRRAFVCDADLRGLRVAVVDDVLTTGATMNELARVCASAPAPSKCRRGWRRGRCRGRIVLQPTYSSNAPMPLHDRARGPIIRGPCCTSSSTSLKFLRIPATPCALLRTPAPPCIW